MLLGGGSSCQSCGCNPVRCFDGIVPDSSYDGFDNATFLAGGITIGGSSQTLTSVTIYNDGSTNAPVYCIVWPNDTTDTSLPYGPRPKVRPSNPPYNFPPECVFLTLPSSFSGSTWTFTHSGLTLSANTIYWIVMAGQGLIPGSGPGGLVQGQNGDGGWKWEEFSFGGGQATDTCYFLSNASANAGASWADNFATNRYLFDLS